MFELPAAQLFSSEFADLMPLMAEPDQYRAVEKNIHRALHGLKSVWARTAGKERQTLKAADLAWTVGGDGIEPPTSCL
jgi:hypothetical protein